MTSKKYRKKCPKNTKKKPKNTEKMLVLGSLSVLSGVLSGFQSFSPGGIFSAFFVEILRAL